ncbi:hypothetical protein MD484_g941, partial [Candolleomyces efflorescens]
MTAAEDYNTAYNALSTADKIIAQHLRKLGENLPSTSDKAWKCAHDGKTGNRKSKKGKDKDRPPKFEKKENATIAQRIEILDWHHANRKNQSKTAAHWDPIYPNLLIKQPLISSWIKDEVKWCTKWAESNRTSNRTTKRVRLVEQPKVNKMLELWTMITLTNGLILTGEVLRQKYHQFARMAGIPEDQWLKLSNGWLESFKARNGLKSWQRHGEAGSSKVKTITEEQLRIQKLIKEGGYTLRNIFNMDETGLFYGMPPDTGLFNCQQSGVKGNKVRITYGFTANAAGTEKLPPIIIGHACCPRALKRKTGEQLGFYYRNNAKAWMTIVIYEEWIRSLDAHFCCQNRHILLLQDNFLAQKWLNDLTNIRVENFEANLTAHVQPMDQGIIRCFKAHYHGLFIGWAFDLYDKGTSPGDIYTINQLEAMRLADIAWREVDLTTI